MEESPHEDLVKKIDMVGEHLRRQDEFIQSVHTEMKSGFAKVDERFRPLESIAGSLDEIVRLAQAFRRATIKVFRWLAAGLAAGALFEIGKIIVDKGFLR